MTLSSKASPIGREPATTCDVLAHHARVNCIEAGAVRNSPLRRISLTTVPARWWWFAPASWRSRV